MIVVPICCTNLPITWLRSIAGFCVLFNGATIGECVYSLIEGRDFPVTLKPFPTYSKVIDAATTRVFTIVYIVISALAVGADLILLVHAKRQPVKALRVFLYWNLFHFAVDLFIISAFFVAVLNKRNADKAIQSSPPFVFVATALRVILYILPWSFSVCFLKKKQSASEHELRDSISLFSFLSILGSVYQTYSLYTAYPGYRDSF